MAQDQRRIGQRLAQRRPAAGELFGRAGLDTAAVQQESTTIVTRMKTAANTITQAITSG